MAKYLFANGFRYRRNDRKLPGTPDIVLKKYRTVIFINGCFWHAHEGCKYFVVPETNREFWIKKLHQNKDRDKRNIQKLRERGWNILVVWECEIRSVEKREKILLELIERIKGVKI